VDSTLSAGAPAVCALGPVHSVIVGVARRQLDVSGDGRAIVAKHFTGKERGNPD